jgi:diacylglycerol kinase family enzyme
VTARYPTIDVIVNPAAGRGKANINAILPALLSSRRLAWEVHRTEGRGHATQLARAAAARGVDLVVAAGGDGTANEVASGLVDTAAVLGLMPVGSGNALARALGIPIDPAKALEESLDGDVRAIDVGTVAGRYFFSTAGVGLDAVVSHLYGDRPGGRRGLLPYLVLTMRAFASYEPTLTVITLDDGLLDLCVIERTGSFRALWHGRRLFSGTIDRMPGVRLFRSRGIRITRPCAGLLQVDGEALEAPATLNVELLPRALRIAVPGGAPR